MPCTDPAMKAFLLSKGRRVITRTVPPKPPSVMSGVADLTTSTRDTNSTGRSRNSTARPLPTTVDSAALLTYRAAWLRDQGRTVTKEAAMAKMSATEGAQQVIDAAVQMFGGLGVSSGHPVEQLYREIRSLRIYEGATEVQQLIIARELLKEVRA